MGVEKGNIRFTLFGIPTCQIAFLVYVPGTPIGKGIPIPGSPLFNFIRACMSSGFAASGLPPVAISEAKSWGFNSGGLSSTYYINSFEKKVKTNVKLN